MLFLHTFLEKISCLPNSSNIHVSLETIRDNFVITYELLDEMMDYGYPQSTESKILKEYITLSANRAEKQLAPPSTVTNAVSWRSPGIKHRKNEIFLDVVESLDLLVSTSGTVLHSEILGAVKMRSYLSGMPELKLGLNDKVMFQTSGRKSSKSKSVDLEDIKFHQVRHYVYFHLLFLNSLASEIFCLIDHYLDSSV